MTMTIAQLYSFARCYRRIERFGADRTPLDCAAEMLLPVVHMLERRTQSISLLLSIPTELASLLQQTEGCSTCRTLSARLRSETCNAHTPDNETM